jgi:hypothetical protein
VLAQSAAAETSGIRARIQPTPYNYHGHWTSYVIPRLKQKIRESSFSQMRRCWRERSRKEV